ncbi:hypothetical protein ACXR2T_08975 [Leucobacter sp. HY1910]
MNVWTSAVDLAVRFAEGTTGGASGASGAADGATTEFNPDKVSPGIEGFLMTGLLALAVIGLGFLLVRTLRTNAYRQDVREQIEAELAEQAEAAGSDGAEVADAGTAGSEASGAVASDAAPDRGDADDSADSSAQK